VPRNTTLAVSHHHVLSHCPSMSRNRKPLKFPIAAVCLHFERILQLELSVLRVESRAISPGSTHGVPSVVPPPGCRIHDAAVNWHPVLVSTTSARSGAGGRGRPASFRCRPRVAAIATGSGALNDERDGGRRDLRESQSSPTEITRVLPVTKVNGTVGPPTWRLQPMVPVALTLGPLPRFAGFSLVTFGRFTGDN